MPKSIAGYIIKLYSKYARRVTPELLNANTYQFSYDEWPTVVREWNNLELRASRVYQKLDPRWYDAYEELVLFPIQSYAEHLRNVLLRSDEC